MKPGIWILIAFTIHHLPAQSQDSVIDQWESNMYAGGIIVGVNAQFSRKGIALGPMVKWQSGWYYAMNSVSAGYSRVVQGPENGGDMFWLNVQAGVVWMFGVTMNYYRYSDDTNPLDIQSHKGFNIRPTMGLDLQNIEIHYGYDFRLNRDPVVNAAHVLTVNLGVNIWKNFNDLFSKY